MSYMESEYMYNFVLSGNTFLLCLINNTFTLYLYNLFMWKLTSFTICKLKLSADKLLLFKWSQAQVHFFFKCMWNKLCSWAAPLKFWFQTDLWRENSAGFYMPGRQSLLTFLAMVTRCSPSSSNFYALIDQNLTLRWVHAENVCSIWKLVFW